MRLPLERIKHSLKKLIDLKSLLSDDELCRLTDEYLESLKKEAQPLLRTQAGLRLRAGELKVGDQIWNEFKAFLDRAPPAQSSTTPNPNSQMLRNPFPFYRRREAKLEEKKEKIVERYKSTMDKPREIAKDLRVSWEFVYWTVEKFKDRVKRLNTRPATPTKKGRQMIRLDPLLLKAISQVLEEQGIYKLSCPKLRAALLDLRSSDAQFSALKIPVLSTLRKVLRETFFLKFGKSQNANPRYRDPSFN
jgi:hypothetical protein